MDPKDVRGFYVLIPCEFCKETGKVPGGKYKHEGEVISCPVCHGNRTVRKVITLVEMRSLLLNWDPEGE
jgi:hypothetical protein